MPVSEAERLADLRSVLLASADPELRFVFLNRAWESVLGWLPEELGGTRAMDLMHPDERHGLVRALERAREDGHVELYLNCRVATRHGHWRRLSWELRFEAGHWYIAGHDTSGRRDEERLAEAQRVAGLGSFEFDVATGSMWWSSQLYDIYGLDADGFDPTLDKVLELIHPEDRPAVIAAHSAVLAGASHEHELELRIVRPDGETRDVQTHARPMHDDHGTIVRMIGTTQDVTERRDADRRLAAREAQLRALVEQVPAIVYTAGLGADAPWDYVSPQIDRLLGYTAEEWSARRDLWWDALHPDDRAAVLEDEEGSARPGGQLRSEYRLRRRDGGQVWVRDEATVIENEHGELRFQGVLLDITERKRAEAEAREKHAQLQAIIDNSPLLVWAKDRDHRYLFANVEHGALVPSEQFVASDREVLETGRSVQREERVRVRGRERTYLVQKFPLRDDEDTVYAVCGIGIDVTERHDREDALRSKVEWSFRIRNAIDQDRLVLHSQPIVDLTTGDAAQEELLVRMLGEDGELIMPGEFLPPAERFDLAPAIDRWVIARAVEIARERRVEVNLSARSIGDPGLPGFVEARLAEARADASKVVFEITETAAAQDLDQVRRLAERLSEMGCGSPWTTSAPATAASPT
jgi:PAS domain S-box-containing protein